MEKILGNVIEKVHNLNVLFCYDKHAHKNQITTLAELDTMHYLGADIHTGAQGKV